MKQVQLESPNFDERDSAIEMLVLHYTDTLTSKEAIEILMDPERKVSAHYVLDKDGTLYTLVDESRRAWHAGISHWRGRDNVNGCSIGIEIVNPGHLYGYRRFTEAQYEVLIPLCQRIKQEYKIRDVDIVAHSDIAPERKKDPGELFDWKRLADNGIGIWATGGGTFVNDLKKLGYKEHNEASITAFQRHWRQAGVDGVWDNECGQILKKLLEQAAR